MTFPIDLHLGQVVIHSHLIFDILSIAIAYQYYLHTKRKTNDHLSDISRLFIVVVAAIGALLGSRILAALENPDLFFHPPDWLYYYSSKTIIGGIAGGIIAVELSKKIIKEKRSTGDLFVFPLILGIGIGRIGCLLTGVSDGTVGLPSNLPWAFDQGDGLPRHPTSLYEIIFLIIFWLVLKKIKNKHLANGILFRTFIAGYFGFRFLIEFIKPIEPIWLNLSAIQFTCLAFVVYYSYSIWNQTHQRKNQVARI